MADTKPCVLIVDDDQSVRDSLRKVLGQAGYAVVVAPDGREGLAHLKQQKLQLLLLDLNLPKLSGFDLLDVAVERCPLVPVIILTGLMSQCVPGALTGADAVIEKPPDVNLLLETIGQLLNEPAERRIRRLISSPGTHPALGPGLGRHSQVPARMAGTARPSALYSPSAVPPCAS